MSFHDILIIPFSSFSVNLKTSDKKEENYLNILINDNSILGEKKVFSISC